MHIISRSRRSSLAVRVVAFVYFECVDPAGRSREQSRGKSGLRRAGRQV